MLKILQGPAAHGMLLRIRQRVYDAILAFMALSADYEEMYVTYTG